MVIRSFVLPRWDSACEARRREVARSGTAGVVEDEEEAAAAAEASGASGSLVVVGVTLADEIRRGRDVSLETKSWEALLSRRPNKDGERRESGSSAGPVGAGPRVDGNRVRVRLPSDPLRCDPGAP